MRPVLAKGHAALASKACAYTQGASLSNDRQFMQQALSQAAMAGRAGEVPVGAVIVQKNTVLCAAHNLTESLQDPTAHAEMLCLRQAASLLGAPD